MVAHANWSWDAKDGKKDESLGHWWQRRAAKQALEQCNIRLRLYEQYKLWSYLGEYYKYISSMKQS